MLILVRAGRNSIHRSWSYLCHSHADVAVSVYDDSDWNSNDVNYYHNFIGGKFQGAKAFFESYPQVIEAYDYFWFFEDDLLLPHATLVRVLEILALFRFTLAAPALSYESYFTWPIAVRNEKMLFRGTDFVEVMAPIMSRDFLKKAVPHFGENYSSFGYEWLWRKWLDDDNDFAAILDVAPIVHTRPFQTGSLGINRPADAPSPQEDFDRIINKYNLSRNPFKNKFGVTRDKNPRIVVEDQLVQTMLDGYKDLLSFNRHNLFRCIDALLKGDFPIYTLRELRRLKRFPEIECDMASKSFREMLNFGNSG